MSGKQEITLAAKCAPETSILADVEKAGITAVELYTNYEWLKKSKQVIQTCKKFPFRYAIHAPTNCYEPDLLIEVSNEINAEVVVFHDIYFRDELEYIAALFKTTKIIACVENIHSVHEPVKFMRRFNMKRCLDLEHLQMQCAGVYKEEFASVMQQASHVHLTGYYYGSNLWHTHIHHSPQHNEMLLKSLKESGYSGFVVSEAKTDQQNVEEFVRLYDYFVKWQQRLCLI